MGHQKFSDIVGEVSPERRARIDAIKAETRADGVAFNLAELRRSRQVTQAALAETLGRSQATISEIESSGDHRLSTVRKVVESMGGHLELVAVFDGERIALPADVA